MRKEISFPRFVALMNNCIAVICDGDLSFPAVSENEEIVEINNFDDDGNFVERHFDKNNLYTISEDNHIYVKDIKTDEIFSIKTLYFAIGSL